MSVGYRILTASCPFPVSQASKLIMKTSSSRLEQTSWGKNGEEAGEKETALSFATDARQISRSTSIEKWDWFTDNRKLSGKFDEYQLPWHIKLELISPVLQQRWHDGFNEYSWREKYVFRKCFSLPASSPAPPRLVLLFARSVDRRDFRLTIHRGTASSLSHIILIIRQVALYLSSDKSRSYNKW